MQTEIQKPARRAPGTHVPQLRAAHERIHLRRAAAMSYIGLGKSAFYKQIQEGLLPQGVPVTPSGSTKAWPLDEIERVLRARAAGWSLEKQRALIVEIHAARKAATV